MPSWTKIITSVYISCLILLSTVFVLGRGESLDRLFLEPLDGGRSVLGSNSAFKKYIQGRRVYAFLPYWNLEGRELSVKNVTDLVYFGVNIDKNARIVKSDGPYKTWRENKSLDKLATKVKNSGGRFALTLICHDDSTIDAILSCESCWEDLAQDVISELDSKGIRDVNLDFESSGYTTPEKAKTYSKLVGYINKALDEKYNGDSHVVVSTFADAVDKADSSTVRLTDPASLAENSDAIFIMAYDFHRPESSSAGPVAPLEGSYSTTRLNVKKVVDGYLKNVPSDKLILGLPFYGYDWVVASHDMRAERVPGNDVIGYSGVITYAQALDFLVKERYERKWDEEAKSPYINYVDAETGSLHQAYFEDKTSLIYKIELAEKNSFNGVGVWALGYEGGYQDIWDIFD